MLQQGRSSGRQGLNASSQEANMLAHLGDAARQVADAAIERELDFLAAFLLFRMGLCFYPHSPLELHLYLISEFALLAQRPDSFLSVDTCLGFTYSFFHQQAVGPNVLMLSPA